MPTKSRARRKGRSGHYGSNPGNGLRQPHRLRFLGAGLGWGGSCFPKDTAALIAVGSEYDYELPITQAEPVALAEATGIDIDVEYVDDPYDVARDSNGLVLATEWDVCRRLDSARTAELMRRPIPGWTGAIFTILMSPGKRA